MTSDGGKECEKRGRKSPKEKRAKGTCRGAISTQTKRAKRRKRRTQSDCQLPKRLWQGEELREEEAMEEEFSFGKEDHRIKRDIISSVGSA